MANPLVSIIIPFYNTERALYERCISSIDVNDDRVETIIIDDGSDAEAASGIDSFVREMDTVRIIHQENGGQNAARKNGVLVARGKYTCFLDSDDWLDWHEFTEILSIAEETDFSILAFDYSLVEGGRIGRPKFSYAKEASHITAKDYIPNRFMLCMNLFSTELLITSPFCIGPRIGEDLVTVALLAMRADQIFTTGHCAYMYLRHDGSITRGSQIGVERDILDAFDFLLAEGGESLASYATEVEWLAIWHVLYRGTQRFIRAYGPSREARVFLEYVNAHFPNWRNNVLLKSKGRGTALRVAMAEHYTVFYAFDKWWARFKGLAHAR